MLPLYLVFVLVLSFVDEHHCDHKLRYVGQMCGGSGVLVNSAYRSSIALDLAFDPAGVVSNLRTISSFSWIVNPRRRTGGGVSGMLIASLSTGSSLLMELFKSSSSSRFFLARARRSADSLRRVATCC